MAPLEDRPRLKIHFTRAAFAALSLLFLWRIAVVFGPGSDHTMYTFDSAFPVIMSNDNRSITLFDFYSYNRDRWGSLPFLLARILHNWTGYYWSPESMHLYRTVWLFSGLLIMSSLVRQARVLLLLSALVAICLPSITRTNMFDLSELYPWQIPGLFFTWYILRRLFAEKLLGPPSSSITLQRGFWCFALFSSVFLTVWISVASGPLLGFLLLLEVSRAILLPDRKPNSSWRLTRYVIAPTLLVLGIFSERILRMYYHRYCLTHYGSENRTPMSFDVGHLRDNLAAQLHVYSTFARRPLLLLSSVLLVALAAVVVYFVLRMRWAPPPTVITDSTQELWIFAIGITGMAVINFVMAVSIEHVRFNFFANRYLTLTFMFVVISNLLTLFLVFGRLLERTRLRKYYSTSFAVVLTLFLLVRFPAPSERHHYVVEKQTAVVLTEKAPGAVLMGRSWATYNLAGLFGPRPMLVVPEEGEDVRMPWTPAMLSDAKQLVLEYRHSHLAISGAAPGLIDAYGNRFRLVDPDFYENESYAFALYANSKN